MNEEIVSWLKSEVRDLLDVSTVGLYEFVWLLRGRQPCVSGDAARPIAERALDELLAEGQGRLVLLIWPSQDSEGSNIEPEALRVDDWDDPCQGKPYVALARN